MTTLSKIQKFTVTLGSVESRRSRVDEVLRGKNIASTKTLQTTNQDNKRLFIMENCKFKKNCKIDIGKLGFNKLSALN